jgi:hypothetical protein
VSIGKPNPYPGIIGNCPDYRAHQPRVSHNVTVESRAFCGYTSDVDVHCSCGKVIMCGEEKILFDEINAAVTRHLALETDDYPGLKSVFAHVEEIRCQTEGS